MAKNDYYGNRGLLRRSSTLTQDKAGLWEGTIVYSCPVGEGGDHVPMIGTPHPAIRFMVVEKVNVHTQDGWDIVEIGYAGADLDANGEPPTQPVYELAVSVGEEPIETHPDFRSVLAGHPGNKLNGAEFDAAVTGKFLGFFDSTNKLYGVKGYLDAGQITWRVTKLTRTSISTLNKVGCIDTPVGPAPELGGSRNWLFMGATSEKRGTAYVSTYEWRASGRRGWDTDIYASA